MTRVFRHYGRSLVLIVMCLLLAIFLIGDVVGMRGRGRGGSGRSDFAIGTAFGHTVYQSDLERAEQAAEIASRFGIGLPLPGNVEQREHLICTYLLIEEARQAGVRFSREEAERVVNTRDPQLAESVRVRYGQSMDGLYEAVSQVLGALVFAQTQAESATAESPARLEHIYRDQFQQAEVQAAAIDAKGLLARVPEPTEEELTANFEAGKNREDGHTDDGLAFGYLTKDRVRIEYLTVDPKICENSIRVRDRDIQRFYDENTKRYTRPVATSAPTAPGQKPPTEVIPLAECRERVKADVRRERAIEESQRLMNDVLREARRPWDAITPDDKGVRAAPATEAQVSFEALAAKFAGEVAVERHTTELEDAATLAADPILGRAGELINQRRMPISALAFRVEGIATPAEADPTPILKRNEPKLAMTPDMAGGQQKPYQLFVYRVLEVAPKGPPASLNDVRDKVIENVKLTKAYAMAGDYARSIAEKARAVGLAKALEEAGEVATILKEADAKSAAATQAASAPAQPVTNYAKLFEIHPAAPFSRRSVFLPGIGAAPKLKDELFTDSTTSQPASQPALQPGEHRVLVSRDPRDFRWILAQVDEIKPIYRGSYEAVRPQIEQQLSQSMSQQFLRLWADPQDIRRRSGFSAAKAASEG